METKEFINAIKLVESINTSNQELGIKFIKEYNSNNKFDQFVKDFYLRREDKKYNNEYVKETIKKLPLEEIKGTPVCDFIMDNYFICSSPNHEKSFLKLFFTSRLE